MVDILSILPSIAGYGASAVTVVVLLWVLWRLIAWLSGTYLAELREYAIILRELRQVVEDYDSPGHPLRLLDMVREAKTLQASLDRIEVNLEKQGNNYQQCNQETRTTLVEALGILKQFASDAERTRQETQHRISQIETNVRDATQDNREVIRELLALHRETIGRHRQS